MPGDTEEQVRAVYELLEQSRKEIETQIGHELDWIDNPGVRSCRIRHRFGDGGLKQQDKWSGLQELMVEEMITFVDALQPHIDALP